MKRNLKNIKYGFCAEWGHLGEFQRKIYKKYKTRGVWLRFLKLVILACNSVAKWFDQAVAHTHEFGHMDLMKYVVLSYSNYLRSNPIFSGGDTHV
jgi:hypothetical protein